MTTTFLMVVFPCLVSTAVLAILHHAYNSFFRLYSTPKHLPWAGAKGLFHRGRATLSSLFHTDEISKNAYNQFSKHGKYFVLPNIFTGPEIIMPPSQLGWLVNQPEDVLNHTKAAREFIQADYTLFNPTPTLQHSLKHIVRRDVTRNLRGWIGLTAEEIRLALSEHWGQDVDCWHEVNVYSSMIKLLLRGVSRVFVGLPLCRDREYLQPGERFGDQFLLYAAGINLLPRFLRPVLGPWIVKSDTRQFSRMKEVLLPVIIRRMKDLTENAEVKSAGAKEQKDALQCVIEEAFHSWEPNNINAIKICEQFVALTAVGIQSSRNTITNVLFDLASSPSATENFAILRAEAESALESAGGIWTQEAVSKLAKHDSALHESLRMWDGRGPMKEVLTPKGVTTPDGLHLPRGAKIGVYVATIHYDADIYPDPTTYKPWRFVADVGSLGTDDGKGGHAPQSAVVDKTAAHRGPSAVTTGRDYMSFGHGRTSCPGRFFAATNLKLLLANIVLYYDIEPIPSRPKNNYLAMMVGPPMEATLRVRRRKE